VPDYYSTILGLNYTSFGDLETLIQNLRKFLA
jgi:hypothetical protein